MRSKFFSSVIEPNAKSNWKNQFGSKLDRICFFLFFLDSFLLLIFKISVIFADFLSAQNYWPICFAFLFRVYFLVPLDNLKWIEIGDVKSTALWVGWRLWSNCWPLVLVLPHFRFTTIRRERSEAPELPKLCWWLLLEQYSLPVLFKESSIRNSSLWLSLFFK